MGLDTKVYSFNKEEKDGYLNGDGFGVECEIGYWRNDWEITNFVFEITGIKDKEAYNIKKYRIIKLKNKDLDKIEKAIQKHDLESHYYNFIAEARMALVDNNSRGKLSKKRLYFVAGW